MLFKEFINHLNDYLQVGSFDDYCVNGVQIKGSDSILKVATAVSCDLETVLTACKMKVDALIVHHGLFWSGDKVVLAGSLKEKVKLLIDNNISLIVYHLPLDAHNEVGNNYKAAKDLGLLDLQPFAKCKGSFIGVKGRIKDIGNEEFCKIASDYYGNKEHSALFGNKVIKSVAIVSGGAYREVYTAYKEGVDFFITGNFDEPAWYFAKEEKINFAAFGHSATEKIGPRALSDYIKYSLAIESEFIDNLNPF